MNKLFLKSVLLLAAVSNAVDIAVMAPLDPRTDSGYVNDLLTKVRTVGATSISVDVWWGRTEPQKRNFDWKDYDRVFARIRAHGLAVTSILSLHACGANVSDGVQIPLPAWVWELPAVGGKGKIRGYFDAQGRENRERVPPWHQRAVLGEYKAWMQAFRNHYDSLGWLATFHEINVSLGPSGELRYPAYALSGCGYPTAGCFQFPTPQSALPDTMSNSFAHSYQETLFQNGRELLKLADTVFGGDAKQVPLGFKWPGLHWRWGHWSTSELGAYQLPSHPYGVLFASGLLCEGGHTGIDSTDFDASLRGFFEGIPAALRKRLVLHFTSLEQPNMVTENGAEVWAKPQELVRWMAWSARRNGLLLKGENALPWNKWNLDGWERLRTNLAFGYSGVTLLRLESFQDPQVLNALQTLTTDFPNSASRQ
jgi:hypothetical protein